MGRAPCTQCETPWAILFVPNVDRNSLDSFMAFHTRISLLCVPRVSSFTIVRTTRIDAASYVPVDRAMP